MTSIDWQVLALQILSSVGLTFDDVYNTGRGPYEDAPDRLSGVTHLPSHAPGFRARALIGLSGPVDSEFMLFILAHECGHVHYGASSIPAYIQEYKADIYAIERCSLALGRMVSEEIISKSREHVRRYCAVRYMEMGPRPIKPWDREVVEWAEFYPPHSSEPLLFYGDEE